MVAADSATEGGRGMEAATARSAPRSLPDLPLLGFRNYWYPVLGSRQLGKRPVAVRLLGEDVVLFRSGGKLGALTDRCPHRGSQLSRGRILFPGTLSCGYHGWTFNPEGQCVAAIVEGPEARVVRKVRVTAYPAEERFGLVWVFLGEGDPPPLDEDLPPELQQAGLLSQFVFEDWACNERDVTENYPDMLHAIYVHRTSLLMLIQKLPAWGTVQIEP